MYYSLTTILSGTQLDYKKLTKSPQFQWLNIIHTHSCWLVQDPFDQRQIPYVVPIQLSDNW